MNKYEITHSEITLWAWYRAGKLRKIEVRKGAFSEQSYGHLQQWVPLEEKHIEVKQKQWKALSYQLVTQDKTGEFKEYTDAWFDFYISNNGVEPKFDGADGKALKQIKAYLEKVSTDGAEAAATWRALLHNWHHLDEFYRKNLDLKFVNSQLNKIITQLKDVTRKATEGHSSSDIRGRL